MDGKQARRTGTSSPLGMIIDHQVDALSVTITATFFNTIVMFGDSPIALVLWFVGAIPFYMATWEELHIGTMIFPIISGPAEGCVGLGALSLYI